MTLHFSTSGLLHENERADKGKVWGHSVPEFGADAPTVRLDWVLLASGTGCLRFLGNLMPWGLRFFALPSGELRFQIRIRRRLLPR